jgi:hypothetical protein
MCLEKSGFIFTENLSEIYFPLERGNLQILSLMLSVYGRSCGKIWGFSRMFLRNKKN